MAFRNEEAALRARIEVLERELAALRDVAEERDRLKERIAQLESQLGLDQQRKQRAAAERAAARKRARDERARRVRQWLASFGGPRVPLTIGGALLAGGVLWSASGIVCGPSRTAAPSVGMVDLDADPTPALPPMSTRGALATPSGCAGFVPSAPQLVLRSSEPVSLRIGAQSNVGGGDLVLLVMGPDGRVACDDDGGDGTDPALTAVVPAGDTRVWVGSYQVGNGIDFRLSIASTPVAAAPDESGLASTAPPSAGVLEGPDASQVFPGTAQPMVQADQVQDGCRGYVPVEPQAEIRLSREAAVRLHARTVSHDLVLLVRSADGEITCDDDSGPGTEPLVARVLGPGVHRVWVGRYSPTTEPIAFTLRASAMAIARDVPVETRALGPTDVTFDGTSRDEVSPDALGARCSGGLVAARPDVGLSLGAPSDVELGLAGSASFAVIAHPDGSIECVRGGQSRLSWGPGVHRVHAGVATEGTPGPYTLTARTVPSGLRPWSPR